MSHYHQITGYRLSDLFDILSYNSIKEKGDGKYIIELIFDSKKYFNNEDKDVKNTLINSFFSKTFSFEEKKLYLKLGADIDFQYKEFYGDVYGTALSDARNEEETKFYLDYAKKKLSKKRFHDYVNQKIHVECDITALHVAKTKEQTRLLIQAGADVNATTWNNETPLHFRQTEAQIKLLLDAGADVNVIDEEGDTPLLAQADKIKDDCKDMEILEDFTNKVKLLSEKDLDLTITSTRENRGYRSRSYESDNERMILVSFFDYLRYITDHEFKKQISKRMFIQFMDKGKTEFLFGFLHLVECKEQLNLLLEAGADVNNTDKKGNTPLHLVQSESTTKLLLEAGADVNAKNKLGNTPLHVVRNQGIARVLLEAGADVNVKNKLGNTPLHVVKSESIAKLLLEAGADVNARNKRNTTPLHDATKKSIKKLLLDTGAK